jgi:Glycosyl transferases group 1
LIQRASVTSATAQTRNMKCVLSYFRSYFDPDGAAPYANHSTGQIARHLYHILQEYGPVQYFGSKDRPEGLSADLFIGHFWAFRELCGLNSFKTKIVFYSVSDPTRTRNLLNDLAKEFGVAEPHWDLPPLSFDHEATMEIADLVFVVGNSYTLDTFPRRWRHKIRLLDYSVDRLIFSRDVGAARRDEFCYVATHCGLRKGFMDVLKTWHDIDPATTRLHAVGRLDSDWEELLARHNNGSITYHGWIDSDAEDYLRVIKSCKFAHIPSYSEGQMGSLLEVIYSGCFPITTRASGVDDEVLKHCLVVEPLNIRGQRDAIEYALSWSDLEYENRMAALFQVTQEQQTWEKFREGVESGINHLLVTNKA